jgi:UDP-N-acetylmuramoyl-tripeptide--D-alanyl-D-alanine ligase
VIEMLFLFFSFLMFSVKRLFVYLKFFQQADYQPSRLLKWYIERHAWDKKGSLALCIGAIISYFNNNIALLTIAFLFLFFSFTEENPLKKGKITLKLTARAKRLLSFSTLFALVSLTVFFLSFSSSSLNFWIAAFFFIQMIPFFLLASFLFLYPDETKRQKKYWSEAKQTLQDINPLVIGITGSYGKTSLKHAAAHLLQASLGPVFFPEKGVNTPMGIAREIRTKMKKGIHYAVIEMAAYGRGSITKLCKLTPPNVAILTIVGKAHLERFGSRDEILKTKAELAQALPEEGILIVNGDCEGCRKIATLYPKKRTFFYGFNESLGKLDLKILSYHYKEKGTMFLISWKGQNYESWCPLFGKTALHNVAGALTLVFALGAQPEYALYAARSLRPVDNRLQVIKDGGVTFLKDAYNSNPNGFQSALETLEKLQGKRRIIVTPGMIELGIDQKKENTALAKEAGRIGDLAFVVGDTNKQALIEGFLLGGMNKENIYYFKTRDQALNHLKKTIKEGDLVLIENDLTDLYEAQVRF